MGLFDFWKKSSEKEKAVRESGLKMRKAKGKDALKPSKKSAAKKSRKKVAEPKAKGAKLKTAGKASKSKSKKTRAGTAKASKKKYSLKGAGPGRKGARPRRAVGQRVPSAGTSKVREKEIGVVIHYFGKISVGVIKLRSRLSVGQKIHVKGAHDDFYQAVTSIQINYENISSAGKGQEVGIKLKKTAHRNDRVYSVPE